MFENILFIKNKTNKFFFRRFIFVVNVQYILSYHYNLLFSGISREKQRTNNNKNSISFLIQHQYCHIDLSISNSNHLLCHIQRVARLDGLEQFEFLRILSVCFCQAYVFCQSIFQHLFFFSCSFRTYNRSKAGYQSINYKSNINNVLLEYFFNIKFQILQKLSIQSDLAPNNRHGLSADLRNFVNVFSFKFQFF